MIFQSTTDRLHGKRNYKPAHTNKKQAGLVETSPAQNHFVLRFRDPAGARTQDPNIKSVVLYLLSYRIPLHREKQVTLFFWWGKDR